MIEVGEYSCTPQIEGLTNSLQNAQIESEMSPESSRSDSELPSQVIKLDLTHPPSPMAGRLKRFLANWEKITSDSYLLSTIQGYKIEFTNLPLGVGKVFRQSQRSKDILGVELNKLLDKGVIEETLPEPGSFISDVFLRPKPDGRFRLILDLTELNKSVEKHHFKMDTLSTAIIMMRQDCYMASVDLQDAYYAVPVREQDRKFLSFNWRGKTFRYTALPNGLSSTPRIFTKITKPIYSTLRKNGHQCFGYIDDSFITAETREQCGYSVRETLNLFQSLGFLINGKKSVVEPTKQLVFLGMVLDSSNMTVSLAPEKREKIKLACQKLLHTRSPKIREVARVIGLLVAAFPGVEHGPLHYRQLELCKIASLKVNAGRFNANMQITREGKQELLWWIHRLTDPLLLTHIDRGSPTIMIETDASQLGWGAHRQGEATGGRWSEKEALAHINVLELTAGELGLSALCKDIHDCHIKPSILRQCYERYPLQTL